MKKILSFLLLTFILCITQTVCFADSTTSDISIEYLDDGSYYLTVLSDPFYQNYTSVEPKASTRSTTTVTKSKTVYYKNASGQTMWYVKVTGTFTYGNGTSKCTAVTPSAASQNTDWKVSNISGSKSGNSATATATGKKYYDGTVISTKTKSVTLSCSSTGVFS